MEIETHELTKKDLCKIDRIDEKTKHIGVPRARRKEEKCMRNVQSERIANETLGARSARPERITLCIPHTFAEHLCGTRLRAKHVRTAFCLHDTKSISISLITSISTDDQSSYIFWLLLTAFHDKTLISEQ